MKRPGLTEAMRRALECPSSASRAMREKLFALGLLTEVHFFTTSLTPRGQAALAAPRVTAAELAMLERIKLCGDPWHAPKTVPTKVLNRAYNSLRLRGFVEPVIRDGRCYMTDAGTTALTNIRAASGSPDYKEN